MTEHTPSVGRIVHYVSHGTPPRPDGSQVYTSECRAAIITAVGALDVGLCVLNPTGLFFHEACQYDKAIEPVGGSWHWPERT